jgi:hypothetical protein
LQQGQEVVTCRPFVRKFIRNTKTNTFLGKDGTWTIDFDSAMEFHNDAEARKTRDTYNLKDCELYYCIGDKPSSYDFALPLARLR